MGIVVSIHVKQQVPHEVAAFEPGEHHGRFVTVKVDSIDATIFFADKVHAQVWLNDALRQVNDIQEQDDFVPCPVISGSEE